MGLTTRGQLRVLEEVMKVIFALAVIVACVAANGSMPTIAEREVDIIPEDEELIQAKAEEMSLVQADADSRYFKDASEVGGGPSESPGILGMNTRTGAQRTVVIRPRDSPGSPNAEPTEDITTSVSSQRNILMVAIPPPQSTARTLTPRRSPRGIPSSLSSTPDSLSPRRERDMVSLMRSPESDPRTPKGV